LDSFSIILPCYNAHFNISVAFVWCMYYSEVC